jgi:RNA polymerase sigma-70 factor, ECF subfamily
MAAPSPQTNDREAELVQGVCREEHEAFYELVRPYERAIYFAAIAVLSNPADAEDVAQETVLKAFNALPNFRFEAKFSTWIIQIAINESRMN